MRLMDYLGRWLAANPMTRRLYPAPTIAFRLRRYEPRDRKAVLELYDRNAPDRFPPNDRPAFEAFLDSACVSFFVAGSPAGEVLACGGVTSAGDHAHTLMYGLVAPAHQGKGIGATLALARLVFASRAAGGHLALINAVPKSLGYYQRFGFAQHSHWLSEGGVDYPCAMLPYTRFDLGDIEITLRRRGHLLDPTGPVERDKALTSKLEKRAWGQYYVSIHPIEPTGTPSP